MENELQARQHQSVDSELIGLLDKICHQIEIPDGRYALAQERFDSIGNYLSEPGSELYQYQPKIYVQGSAWTGTTVKPPKGNEFDVDLICQLLVGEHYPQQAFKQLIYDRLARRGCYKLIMMNRAIRVQYVDEFHLDITPAIPDLDLGPQNIKVTDKEVGRWKESNPKEYALWFKAIGEMEPDISYKNRSQMEALANIEPLPAPTLTRPLLNRIVQLEKTHRNHMFGEDKNAPISAIIATLTAMAYEHQIRRGRFDSYADFVRAVVRSLPQFLTPSPNAGGVESLPNPANPFENYADKWIARPQRRTAFFHWHPKMVEHFDRILGTLGQGSDEVHWYLANSFGASVVNEAVVANSAERLISLEAGLRGVQRGSGLITSTSLAAAYVTSSSVKAVPRHTNFGS